MRPSIKLMALIDQHGAISASEAGELLGLSRSHVGRQAHNLVGRGWAREIKDPDDKRVIMFDLTRAGKKALDGGNSERRHHAVARVAG